MQPVTKVMLSSYELSLVTDTEWILTKHQILEKVGLIFSGCQKSIDQIASGMSIPNKLFQTMPRIARGEKYQGLPYMMLDYPAFFNKEEQFALRTFFWWGNFFSINLQVSGNFRKLINQVELEKLCDTPNQVYICVHQQPWSHHFEPTNFVACEGMNPATLKSICSDHPFLKIALKYELVHWQVMPSLLEEGYEQMLKLLSCPNDETGLLPDIPKDGSGL